MGFLLFLFVFLVGSLLFFFLSLWRVGGLFVSFLMLLLFCFRQLLALDAIEPFVAAVVASKQFHFSKQLEETTNALKKTSEELEEEKKKTDLLLYQLLPPKVANQLKNGKQVEAGKY